MRNCFQTIVFKTLFSCSILCNALQVIQVGGVAFPMSFQLELLVSVLMCENTVYSKLVCSYIHTSNCPTECTPTVDLCLAVDTSRSIKNFQIDRQNQALSQLAEQVDVGTGRCQSRVAAVVYGNRADMSFGLSDYTDSPSLAATLGNLPRESNYRKGGTRTDLALEKCAQILEDEGQSGKCNQKVIIVFLDGKPHPRNANLAAILGSIKSQGIKVCAVGASTRTSREDLLELALDEPDHVLQSNNFFGLMKIVPDIADCVDICPQCGR